MLQRYTLAQDLLRDLLRWSRFDHPNLAPLLGLYDGKGNFGSLSVVTEWQQYGNILQYVELTHPDEEVVLGLVEL